jgi:hypothetical protein
MKELGSYVDPIEDRRRWRLQRPDVEARWCKAVLERLRQGTALTSELATAANIKPGAEYSRFLTMLRRRPNLLRNVGKKAGPTGHPNHVWELVR